MGNKIKRNIVSVTTEDDQLFRVTCLTKKYCFLLATLFLQFSRTKFKLKILFINQERNDFVEDILYIDNLLPVDTMMKQ